MPLPWKTKNRGNITYVQAEGRVCPLPKHWNALYELLPDRRQRMDGGWEPALPLILAAWWDTPPLAKMLRLREHIGLHLPCRQRRSLYRSARPAALGTATGQKTLTAADFFL